MLVYKIKMGILQLNSPKKSAHPFCLGGKKNISKNLKGSPQDGSPFFEKPRWFSSGRPLWRPDSDVDGAPNPATPHRIKIEAGHHGARRLVRWFFKTFGCVS